MPTLAWAQGLGLQTTKADNQGENVEQKIAYVVGFYERCMVDIFQDATELTRDNFCNCTADKALFSLPAIQLQTLAGIEGGDAVDLKKFLYEVQAPCLHFIIKEQEFNECLHSGQYRNFFKTKDAYRNRCYCIANTLSSFIETEGVELMRLAQKGKSTLKASPIKKMKRSKPYQAEKYKSDIDCLDKYKYQ